MSAVSDLILEDNADVLEQMLEHPFVRAISKGTVTDRAYHRYLVYEGAFVDTAVSIFAYATAKAPDIDAKCWLIGVQDALARDQIPYFKKSFDELSVDTTVVIPAPVEAFDQGMLDIARKGDFLQIVTAMFAAEWMYWTWCSRASGSIEDPHIRQWVDLHAAPEFEAQAHWLKNAIDRYACPTDRERLSSTFRHVTQLEIAFHDAPLAEDEMVPDA